MDNDIHLGNKIDELRKQQHLSFRELGDELGLSQGAAAHFAQRDAFDVRLLYRIGVALNYNFFKHFPIEEKNQTKAPDERDKTIEAKDKVIGELQATIAQLEKEKMEMEMLRKENGFLKEINDLLKKK